MAASGAKNKVVIQQDEVERQLAALAKLRADFTTYAPTCLKIKTKSGKLVEFVLNKAQLYIHQRLEAQRAATGKVRALVLKGRQQGASTYIGGRFYHKASLNSGTSVFILTHEQAATDNLFNMVARYHDNTPLRPSTGAANAKELVFNKLDSGYSVATAGQKAAGRSKTTQLFHGSEVAFWPNATDHFAASVQTVPDESGTEIILESTANGVTGEFYERWQQAEAGIGDYIAIFVPWFWDPGYRREVPVGFILSAERPDEGMLSEMEYAEIHGCSLEQMVWRRAKVRELGSELFMQEYPATAEEAFQTTGHDSFIKPADVLRARKVVIAEEDALGPLILGVDPSREGDDRFVVTWRRGRKVLKYEARTKVGTIEAANWIRSIIEKDDPDKVFMDVGGNGGAVYDVLVSYDEKFDRIVELVNFGSEPLQDEILMEDGSVRPGPKNRRAEMWYHSREWLRTPGGVDIPDEGVIQSDACAPGYKHDIHQRLVLESKESMRKRGQRSPDIWDSIALTFAAPVRSKMANSGRPKRHSRSRASGSTGWMAA